jgi:hypothetical protein
MPDLAVDVSVPYTLKYRGYRERTDRVASLVRAGKVCIITCSAEQAPCVFHVGPSEGQSFDIRWHDNRYWWPVRDRDDQSKVDKAFLAELASGAYPSVSILNPARLWYSGNRGTIEDIRARDPRIKVVSDDHDDNLVEMQRGASTILLCADTVYFRGSAPFYFGFRRDLTSENSMSLEIGFIPQAREPQFVAGASGAVRRRALMNGDVFDPVYLTNHPEALVSQNISPKTVDTIAALSVTPESGDLEFISNAILRAVLKASPHASAEHRGRLPKEWHGDALHMVSPGTCYEVLHAVLSAARYQTDSRLAEPLARAVHLMHQPRLAPADDEALAELSPRFR